MNLSTVGDPVHLAYGKFLAGNRGHRLEGAAEAVRDRREDVQVLAVGKIVQETEEDQGMDPPEDALGRRKGVGKESSHQGSGDMLADRHEKRLGQASQMAISAPCMPKKAIIRPATRLRMRKASALL